MALFKKEPEKNPKIQPTTTPQASSTYRLRLLHRLPPRRPRRLREPTDLLRPRDAHTSIADRKSPAKFRSRAPRESTARSMARSMRRTASRLASPPWLPPISAPLRYRSRARSAAISSRPSESKSVLRRRSAETSRRRCFRFRKARCSRGIARCSPRASAKIAKLPYSPRRSAWRRPPEGRSRPDCPGRLADSPRSRIPMMERVSKIPQGRRRNMHIPPNWGTFFALIVSFLVFWFIFSRLFFRPFLNLLSERERRFKELNDRTEELIRAGARGRRGTRSAAGRSPQGRDRAAREPNAARPKPKPRK